jgi:hypothetical protein
MRESFRFNPKKESPDQEMQTLEKAMNKIEERKTSLNEIDMNNFEDLYERKFIEIDLDYVKDKEEEFEEDRVRGKEKEEMRVRVMEAITIFYLSRWLGENVSARKSSRYDDIRNKVDAIAEINEESRKEILALAVDVAHVDRGFDRQGNPGRNITKKLAKIKEEIAQGKLSMIKYYESADGKTRKKLTRIPRVVIGADKETLGELAELWVENEEKLAHHPIQYQIVDEIIQQLETFSQYAQKIGRTNLSAIFQKQLGIFRRIAERKERSDSQSVDRSYRQNDRAYLALRESLRNFSNLK